MASNSNGKRKYNAIDLTGDDDAPSASQGRRAPPGEGVAQSQRDSWVDQGIEDDADDIIISSQDGDDTATASYQLYGKFAPSIAAGAWCSCFGFRCFELKDRGSAVLYWICYCWGICAC